MSWDGKMYDKYKIAHTDGTPLKGKKYFVMRLDSHDPVESARVAAAMRAYKSEPRNCDRFQTKEDAAMAFNKERSVFIPQSILWQLGEWLDWLFAPAPEKKVGNDGNE